VRILYLCADPGIPVRGHKGASIHVRALTDAFSSLGHSVTLVTPRPGPSDGPRPQARLIEVPAPAQPADASAAERERAARAAAESLVQIGKQLLAEERFDLIYERYSLWSEAGAQLAAETRLPYVVEVNAPLRVEAARYRSLADPDLAARIEARIVAAASALVVVSEPLRAYLLEQGASPQKVHVIPNAVDENRFHPAVDGNAMRARLGLADKFVVGFVGTTRPWHDLETLIAAMARLTSATSSLPELQGGHPGPYHLLLVGEISDSVRATITAHGLGDSVTIAGPVPNSEIPGWLAAMDVAISPHPGLSDFYFSPLKLFEYLACGKAVVAANVAPLTEVVTDGIHALLYAPGDEADLASRIESLARDPALRASLGFHGARHILLHHTWKQNARATLEVVANLHAAEHARTSNREDNEPTQIWDEEMSLPLYRATRLDLASEALSKHLAHGKESGAIRLKSWKALKYNPGRRCVIAYETDREEGQSVPKIIGKVFRDARGAGYYNTQRELWAGGFGSDAADRITVAEPIAYIPEMHMLLQACVAGQPLDKLLNLPGFERRVMFAAEAIAKLHGLRLQLPSRYLLDSELANLDGWATRLSDLRPNLASTFRLQLSRLQSLASDLPSIDPVPVHRDFHYGQLLYSDNTVTLIDLDLLSLGDPAIDVANFAAHLQFLAIQYGQSPHDLDLVKEAFVQAYLERRPLPEAAQRLEFYEAATLFRLMYVALSRPQFTPFFEPLLQAAEEKTRWAVET
jgi:glycosyltransferase involved in cell wall biosynthesis